MKIDLIYAAGGYSRSWSYSHGIENFLKKYGYNGNILMVTPNLLDKSYTELESHLRPFEKSNADFLLVVPIMLHKRFPLDDLLKRVNIVKVAVCQESIGLGKSWKKISLSACKYYDFVFTSDEMNIKYYKKGGQKNAFYLPQFVDTDIFRPMKVEQKYSYAFWGTVYKLREKLCNYLNNNLTDFHCGNPNRTKDGSFSEPENTMEMVKIYNETRVLFNLSTLFKGLTSRIAETLACRRIILAPYLDKDRVVSENLFQNRQHLLKYDSSQPKELVRIAKEILDDKREYERIAEQGYQEVIKNYDYNNRFQQIFQCMKNPDKPIWDVSFNFFGKIKMVKN